MATHRKRREDDKETRGRKDRKQANTLPKLLHFPKTSYGSKLATAEDRQFIKPSLEIVRRANFRRRLGKLNPCPVTSAAGSPTRGPPAKTPIVRTDRPWDKFCGGEGRYHEGLGVFGEDMRDQRDRQFGVMERLRRKAWYPLPSWSCVVCPRAGSAVRHLSVSLTRCTATIADSLVRISWLSSGSDGVPTVV
ncbi:hypothetical protein V499_09252 [Pseudogymnoascus sp. VKM F-103]|nr:hypothetical protein V499_09252 [Pseudogymnoascus sp. VKM F-103]